ncbi:MAG: hypothetical protein U0V72_12900 [Cytophagales bacterium]
MNKFKYIFLWLTVALYACTSSKKMSYIFPETMSESVKKEYLRQCEKGYVLYNINCAKCHTVKNKIPDFTPAQIYGYEMRLSNKQHEAQLTTETITTEELGYILSFLSYKKKSGLEFKGTHPDN